MPHDPEKIAECQSWLDRAWADLDSAAILLGPERARPDTALFHCQQAAEKAWKAFLVWHDVAFRKTHNLRELGKACADIDPTLAALAERAEDLTQFAWIFRYPGEPEEPSREEAEEAFPASVVRNEQHYFKEGWTVFTCGAWQSWFPEAPSERDHL